MIEEFTPPQRREIEKIARAKGGTASTPGGGTGSSPDQGTIATLQQGFNDLVQRVGNLERYGCGLIYEMDPNAVLIRPATPAHFIWVVNASNTSLSSVVKDGDRVHLVRLIDSTTGGGTSTGSTWFGADITSWNTPVDMDLSGWASTGGTAVKCDETNTGIPPGVTLTVSSGDYHTTADAQQVDALYITGIFFRDHVGVKVRSCRIDGGTQGYNGGVNPARQYQDRTGWYAFCQIGSDGLGAIKGTGVSDFGSMYRCNVFRFLDVIHPTGPWQATRTEYRDCFFHTPVVVAGFGSDPNADSHSDVMQFDPSGGGAFGNIMIHHCTLRAWGISDRTTPKQSATKAGGQNDGNTVGSLGKAGTATAANGLVTDGIIINNLALAKDFWVEYCYFEGKPYGHFTTGPASAEYSNINVTNCIFDRNAVHATTHYSFVNWSSNYYTDGLAATT